MKFVIIGKPGCPWCDKVKTLLKDHSYTYIELTGQPGDTLRTFLIDNGLKTVPQVFSSGWHIGGYEHTEEYLKNVSSDTSVCTDQLRNRNDPDMDTYHFNF